MITTILLVIAAAVILVLALDKAFGFLPEFLSKSLKHIHNVIEDGKVTLDEIIEELKNW